MKILFFVVVEILYNWRKINAIIVNLGEFFSMEMNNALATQDYCRLMLIYLAKYRKNTNIIR